MKRPPQHKESQINSIEEVIQQLYESNKLNEKVKLDDQPIETEKKLIKVISLSNSQCNKNLQKSNNKETTKSNN